MTHRRTAIVIGPEMAPLVERRLQGMVADGWVPVGSLSCAAVLDGKIVVVGVMELPEEDAPVPTPSPVAAPAGSAARKPVEEAEDSPDCPSCGGPMVRRARKIDGRPFWGCGHFPECKGIVNWQEWQEMSGADDCEPF